MVVPNTGLAQVSNVTLVLAIAVYAIAMLLYACDLAFGKRQAAAPASARLRAAPVEEAALVGAAGRAERSGHAFPADPADPSELADLSDGAPGQDGRGSSILAGVEREADGSVANGRSSAFNAAGGAVGHHDHRPGSGGILPEPALAAPSQSRWPSGSWARAGFLLTCVGLVLHMMSVATRGLAEHRVPWGNMYEFIAAITCASVLMFVLAAARFRAYYLGLFVLLPVVLALAVDVVVIYTPAGQLVPALQSYWIAIHVTAMIIAIGMFVLGAVVTVLYLLSARHESRVDAGLESAAAGIMGQLPSSATFDKLSYRAILFAFPAWTFAVIAGAMWADHAWGRYWGWDPKETWSFIIWLVYAAFLHARATAGWRGRRAAYIQLFGFACLVFNLVAVNLWVHGLHSYAGLH